jgi:hypothetical protein
MILYHLCHVSVFFIQKIINKIIQSGVLFIVYICVNILWFYITYVMYRFLINKMVH